MNTIRNNITRFTICIIVTLTISIGTLSAQTYTYDFSTGKEGWVFGYSDYSPTWQTIDTDTTIQWTSLPSNIDATQNSVYVIAPNESDDLFAYGKKKITGLLPNTKYAIEFIIEFASDVPTGAIGVGGPAGEGVTMKVGATLVEPDTIIVFDPTGNYASMNLDKGNQVQGGKDMISIGHIGVTDTTTEWTLKVNSNEGSPFYIETDEKGEVWIIFGTDSGFESTTWLYYNKITANFMDPQPVNNTYIRKEKSLKIFKIANKKMLFTSGMNCDWCGIYNAKGMLVKRYDKPGAQINLNLKSGAYIARIARGEKFYSYPFIYKN